MAEVAVAEAAASTVWKVASPFIGFIVVAALGFGAAELFEHRSPGPTITVPVVGWKITPFGESLAAQLTDYKAAEPARLAAAQAAGVKQQAASDAPAFAQWQASLTAAQADTKTARDTGAAALAKTDTTTANQAAEAFRLGRATCETANAPPAPGPVVPCAPGSVCKPADDFADTFNPGAYAPASQAPVSGGGGGAHPR